MDLYALVGIDEEQDRDSQVRIVTLSEEMVAARRNWIVTNEERSPMQLTVTTTTIKGTTNTSQLEQQHQHFRDHKKHRDAVQVMPPIAESSLVTVDE